ncbi:hypothetical protein AAMO2058_000197200 [Amorphochlora amoebiformis]
MWISYFAGLVIFLGVSPVAHATVEILADNQKNKTLFASTTYFLQGQVIVLAGNTLTIQKGTTIYATPSFLDKSTVLIVEQGAKIVAEGTKDEPITFTTARPTNSTQYKGLWGGIIICGKAPISSVTGTNEVEGLTLDSLGGGGFTYGGSDAIDNSGILKYVRIWHGGVDLMGGGGPEGSGVEINGLTLAGVGSGTTIEHVEVAFNLDDGFEIMGGTVNLRYVSSLFNGDDAFDIDEGYTGKIQFAFGLVNHDGDHALEVDSNSLNSPRTFPQIYGATFIKALHNTDQGHGLIEIRNGAGGIYSNLVAYGYASYGLQTYGCPPRVRTSTNNTAAQNNNFMYFSSKNILYTQTSEGVFQQFNITQNLTCINDTNPDWNATALMTDPELQLVPNTWTNYTNIIMIDPRPIIGGRSYLNVESVPEADKFFIATDFKGGFGSNLWIDGWSWISENGYLPSETTLPTPTNSICGNLTGTITLKENNTYYLTCQAFVLKGAVLNIEKGVTIKAYRQDVNGKAPTIAVQQDARIEAVGTSEQPITFTSVLPDIVLPQRGTWGGLILLGNARISTTGGRNNIEGLDVPYGRYGGVTDSDNSGTLQYVRVWYGGADIGFASTGNENSGNEINGITFGGVGSATTVEHVEVAWNKDDGFEMFGGSVNLKFCSSIFNQDDAFDTDEGYQGKMQFLFAIVDKDGDRACEMDSKTNDNLNSMPRSFPQMYSSTFIKAEHDTGSKGLMLLREGTGGVFANLVLSGFAGAGMENDACGLEKHGSWSDGNGGNSIPNYLYWSSGNIINTNQSDGSRNPFSISGDCTWDNGPTSREIDPNFQLLPSKWTTWKDLNQVDPRPIVGSNMFDDTHITSPSDDGFFSTPVGYIGAFGTDLWNDKWSWLSENGLLPSNDVIPTKETTLCGEITTSRTLLASTTYYLTCQTFVKAPAELTIEAGTTIRAYRVGPDSKATALVIEQGAKIHAVGSVKFPITMTNVLNPKANPRRQTWGGLIILGKAPIGKAGGNSTVEGLDVGIYGGTDPNDNSGELKYFRVWYGGADIGGPTSDPENSGNEINGMTLAGVGAGTTIEHCEVAWNDDDGFEFFGGTVNARWLSSIYNKDDSFDCDEGYQGRLQFLFALLDKDGNHALEVNSKTDGDINSQPRTFPQLYGGTFVKAGQSGNDGLVRLQEGTGGRFANLILTGKSEYGLEHISCGSETHSVSSIGVIPNSLYFSQNNIVYTQTANGLFQPQFTNCLWANDVQPNGQVVDPNLLLIPVDFSTIAQIDPRPVQSGNAFTFVESPPTGESFFVSTTFSGAFGTDLWLDSWSYLGETQVLPANEYPEASNTLCGRYTTSQTLSGGVTHYLTCPVFFARGTVLTINSGSIIKAYAKDSEGKAVALIMEQGSKIIAKGTASEPITFTSVLPKTALPKRGTWGGVIILGEAVTNNNVTVGVTVEGLGGLGKYGGSNDNDDSGIMEYVRIWYAGADLNPSITNGQENSGNEINGLTLAGVGSGTTISHVEVAYSLDDGIEIFGGTVDLSYCSSFFNQDDQIDLEAGYRGKLSNIFVMVGNGHRGIEIDSTRGDPDIVTPRTRAEIAHATVIGNPLSTSSSGAIVASVLSHAGTTAVKISTCSQSQANTTTTDIPNESSFKPQAIYLDPFMVISDTGTQVSQDTSCGTNAISTNQTLSLRLLPTSPTESIRMIDPRPKHDNEGPWRRDKDVWSIAAYAGNAPFSNQGFQISDYNGAFGKDLWLDNWSLLWTQGMLPENEWDGDPTKLLCGPITSDLTLEVGTYYLLCEVQVQSPAILTIPAGTTVRAYAQDSTGKSPLIVVQKGAKLVAIGSVLSPITFTSARPETLLPIRGSWGGIAILGEGTSAGGSSNTLDGLTDGSYGGTMDAGSSGSLKHVRIWNAGGAGLAGLTLAGVGSGTSVALVEVGYSNGDGFQMLGGTVNARQLSSIFNSENSFNIQKGYSGALQDLFALVGQIGRHALQISSQVENNVLTLPRTFPIIYGLTLIGGGPDNPGNDAVLNLQDQAGGVILNLIIQNTIEAAVVHQNCLPGSNNTQGSVPTSVGNKDFMYISPNSIIYNSHEGQFQRSSIDSSCESYSQSQNGSFTVLDSDPSLISIPFDADTAGIAVGSLDPRPEPCSASCDNVDLPVQSIPFLRPATCKGAFQARNWLSGLSFLSDRGYLISSAVSATCTTDSLTSALLYGSMTFANVECNNPGSLLPDVRSKLVNESGLSDSNVYTFLTCGSSIIDFTLTYGTGPEADQKASAFGDRLSRDDVLGAALTTQYGTPRTISYVQSSTVVPDTPTPAPTPAPSTANTNQDTQAESDYVPFMAVAIFLAVVFIVVSSYLAIVYIRLPKELRSIAFGYKDTLKPRASARQLTSMDAKSSDFEMIHLRRGTNMTMVRSDTALSVPGAGQTVVSSTKLA